MPKASKFIHNTAVIACERRHRQLDTETTEVRNFKPCYTYGWTPSFKPTLIPALEMDNGMEIACQPYTIISTC